MNSLATQLHSYTATQLHSYTATQLHSYAHRVLSILVFTLISICTLMSQPDYPTTTMEPGDTYAVVCDEYGLEFSNLDCDGSVLSFTVTNNAGTPCSGDFVILPEGSTINGVENRSFRGVPEISKVTIPSLECKSGPLIVVLYLCGAISCFAREDIIFDASSAIASVPTLSQWALIVLALLLLSVGTAALYRQKHLQGKESPS